jgi:uncharacterized protein YndB with AHSA1/START domain
MAARTNALKVTTPSDTTILLEREFDAPQKLVWEAVTTPEYIKQWWGRRGSTLTRCDVDFRVGGEWHFTEKGAEGDEHPFRGEYREIVPTSKIVQTFIYDVEPFNQHVAVESYSLIERDGKTVVRTLVEHDSKEARDGHLHSGMEQGAGETMDRLEELLAKLA